MKRFSMMLVFLMLMAGLTSCIVIDDHEDFLREHVIFVNHTGWRIDNFIDDDFVGVVYPFEELHVSGRHLEGSHIFYSETTDGSFTWGPTRFYIDDGETLIIDLEVGSWSSHRQEKGILF